MVIVLVQVAILAVPACLMAFALRSASVPGGRSNAAIVAGVFIGLLGGPGILGQVRPEWYRSMFAGSVKEAAILAETRQRHAGELKALREIDVTAAAIQERRREQEREIAPLDEALTRAVRTSRERRLTAAQALLGLFLLSVGPVLLPTGSRSFIRLARALPSVGAPAAAAGIAGTAVAFALPAIVSLLWIAPPSGSIAIGLAFAAPGISAALRPGVFIAAGFAVFACAASALLAGWSIGMTFAGGGLLLGLLLALGVEGPRLRRTLRRRLPAVAHAILLPTIVALLAVSIDLDELMAGASSAAFWWCVIIGVLWSADGRWIGAWCGWKLFGPAESRPVAWTCAAQGVNAAAGVAQTALALLLWAADVLPDAAVPGLLIGAIMVEATRGVRSWLASRLDDPAG